MYGDGTLSYDLLLYGVVDEKATPRRERNCVGSEKETNNKTNDEMDILQI